MGSFDFSGLSNTTTWTDGSFGQDTTNYLQGQVVSQTANGSLHAIVSPTTTTATTRFKVVGRTWSGTISSQITLKGTRGQAVTDDIAYVSLYIETGVNAWKGYTWFIINSFQRLGILNSTSQQDPGTAPNAWLAANTTDTMADGDTFQISLNLANGAIVCKHNGTTVTSVTDTTFTSGLTAGAAVVAGNHGGTGISRLDTTGDSTGATIAVGGSGSNGTASATSVTSSSTTTQASGSSFVARVAYSVQGSVTSVLDNKGNFFTAVGPEMANPTDGRYERIYVFANGTGGAGHTCTANFNTAQGASIIFAEVTGGATSQITDAQTLMLAGGGSPYAAPFITNTPSTLLLGFVDSASTSGTQSFSSSLLTNSVLQYTNATSNFGSGALLSATVTSAGRYDSAISDSAGFARALVAFMAIKQAGSSGADTLLGQACL